MKRFLVGGCAALLVLACADDPSLYLGGPAGSPTALELSSQRFVLRAGATATIAGQLRDEVGNAVSGDVSFASCDPAKVTVGNPAASTQPQWTTEATVTAVALGDACLTATAASFLDTIQVRIVPGTIVITGPDTVLSGGTATFGLEFHDLNGATLATSPDFPIPEVVSLNTFRLPLSVVDPLTYDAAGQAPGNVTLQTATGVEYGSVTADKVVRIVPGVFTGTLSAATAAQGGAITVTGDLEWDGDEFVTIGGEAGSLWSGVAADAMTDPSTGSLTFLVPWSLAPGDYSVTVLNQGAVQVAQTVTTAVTVTAGTPVVNRQVFPGNNTSGAELRDKISLTRPLAFPVVLSDSANPGDRSYYTLDNRAAPSGNAGEVVLRVRLDWVDSCGQACDPAADEDIDIEVIDGGFTAFLDLDGATLAVPESTLFNFQEQTFYFVRIRSFSGATQTHVVIDWLGDGGLCGDGAGCVINGEN
jgi:hypothetical protein